MKLAVRPAARRTAVAAVLVAALASLAGHPGVLAAQTSVRRDPRAENPVLLAQLAPGTRPATGQTRGDYVEVTLEGWVRAAATSPTTRDGFDLIINVSAGEDLRAEPNGPILGRLRYAVLVNRSAARPGWVQVRRTGWVERAALEAAQARPAPKPSAAAPSTAPAAAPAQRPAQAPVRPTGPQPTVPAATSAAGTAPAGTPSTTTAGAAPGAAAGAAAGAADRVEVAHATPIYSIPAGGQLGTLQPGSSARTVGQVGEWVKVQVEGWVRESDLKASTNGALVGVTAAELRAEPAKFVGQTVEWRVQFIALQTADELRPELPQGQPYLLVRGPLPEPGFVYVTVAREEAARFRALQPLQELVIRGVVRAAQTRYLPTPVLELVSMRTAEAAAGR